MLIDSFIGLSWSLLLSLDKQSTNLLVTLQWQCSSLQGLPEFNYWLTTPSDFQIKVSEMHQNGASSSNGAGLEADRGASGASGSGCLAGTGCAGQWGCRMCWTIATLRAGTGRGDGTGVALEKKKHLYSCRLCLCGVQNTGRLASWIFGLWIRESPWLSLILKLADSNTVDSGVLPGLQTFTVDTNSDNAGWDNSCSVTGSVALASSQTLRCFLNIHIDWVRQNTGSITWFAGSETLQVLEIMSGVNWRLSHYKLCRLSPNIQSLS